MRKTSAHLKSEDILRNISPGFLKRRGPAKVIKHEGRLRSGHRPEETEDT